MSSIGWAPSTWSRATLPRAEHCFGEALRLNRRIGHRRGEAAVLLNWPNLWTFQHRLRARAVAHYHQATAIFSDLGERRGEAYARVNGGDLLIILGQFEEARVQVEAALSYFREVGDPTRIAMGLAVLANLALEERRLDLVRVYLGEALLRVRAGGGRYTEAQVLLSFAELALEEGEPEAALTRLDEAAALARAHTLHSLAPDTLALHTGEAAPPFWHLFVRFQARAAAGDPEAHLDLDRAHAALHDSLADLTSEEARRSLTRVTAHRQVVGAWEARFLRRRHVSLPSVRCPPSLCPAGGRPARANG